LTAIPDTSVYVYSFNGYLYGDNVAELREEVAYKLSVTNAAGMNGKRIGENFQDLKRLIIAGQLNEEDTGGTNETPLRYMIQRFRFAHRAEIGKAKLVLNSAADGRPAEFVNAAVENINGLKYEAPLTVTDFEVSFVAEPEIWFDNLLSVNLRAAQVVASPVTTYTQSIVYAGPDAVSFADAEALPLLHFVVASLNTAQLGTADPPYVRIQNNQNGQSIYLYPDANGDYFIDSYEEGIRKGASWAAGMIYETADYDQFLYLVGNNTAGGVTNTITLTCRHCDVTTATAAYYARHW
jgi:hypothetical protein